MKKEKGSWKNTVKSLAYLVGFVFVLNAVNFTLDMWLTFLGGSLRGDSEYYRLAFYYGIIFFGVVFAGIHYYGFFHKFTARTVGVPVVEEAAKKLVQANKDLQEKVLDLAAANASLNQINERLREDHQVLLDNYDNLHEIHVRGKPVPDHFDDWALDQFVTQMRATLAQKREDDFGGWNDQTTVDDLRIQLMLQANKGEGYFNPVHVANFAMMIWARDAFPEECKTSNPNA